MTKHHQLTIAFAALAFGASEPFDAFDALHVREPRVRSSTCHATSLFSQRERLFAPEPGESGPGGGGDEKKFTEADVTRMIQDRVKGLTTKLAAAEATAARVAEIEAKLAESDADRQRAIDEKALEGKSEAEKLQHQLKKINEARDAEKADYTRRLTESEGVATKAQGDHRSYVQRHLIGSALSEAGIAKGANKAAVLAFLAEAQLDLDENNEFKAATVGGKQHAKLADAAKQFLTDNPFFAAPAGGGSGGPRSSLGGGAGVDNIQTLNGLLSAGLSQHAANKP